MDELEGIPVINLHLWFDKKLTAVTFLRPLLSGALEHASFIALFAPMLLDLFLSSACTNVRSFTSSIFMYVSAFMLVHVEHIY